MPEFEQDKENRIHDLPLYERDDGKLVDKHTGLTLQQIATFADASYQKYNATKRAYLKRIDPRLQYDPELSDKYTLVAKDIRNNNVFISHRGTKPSDAYDLHADLFIIGGEEKKHKRFKQAQEHLDRVRAKYGDNAHITLSSHSLGGTIARNLGRTNDGLQVYAFNPGSATSQVRDEIRSTKHIGDSNILNLHVVGDPISVLSHAGSEKVLNFKKKSLSSHSLSNFTSDNLELI